MAHLVDVNVGLHSERDHPNSEAPYERAGKAVVALSVLAGSFSVFHRVEQSSTEPTLVARFWYSGELDDLRGQIYKLAKRLDQDCIAVFVHEEFGELIGPNASAWGDFDPQYFLPYA